MNKISELFPRVSKLQERQILNASKTVGMEKAIQNFERKHTVQDDRWVKLAAIRKSKRGTKILNALEESGEQEILPEVVEVEEVYVAPYITSFSQLKDEIEVQNLAQAIRDVTRHFVSMTWNIIDYGFEDRIESLRKLQAEYIVELSNAEAMAEGGDLDSNSGGTEVLAESYDGMNIQLAEGEEEGKVTYLDAQIIEPGWGNSRDNNYYPRKMLERDAERFVKAKMFESNHDPEKKSTKTWVSTVKEIVGFTETGAPIARIAIHDNDFAERIRNLDKADLLSRMECSILANGRATGGFEKDGRKGRVVEAITDVSSVDWVTKAGAGGKALNLAESEEGGNMPEDTKSEDKKDAEDLKESQESKETKLQESETTKSEESLKESQISEVLGNSRLPKLSQERLAVRPYANLQELEKAITEEIEYVAELTRSGKPFGLAESAEPVTKPDPAKLAEAKDAVNDQFLG